MAEIERKFLVREMPRAESGSAAIEQGYLALDERGEVRLRRIGGELLLTAKSGSGESREEVEVPIVPSAFEALWPLTAGRRVHKVRHYVPLHDGLRAELDVYTGKLDGLLTAEVEFASLADADRFEPPAWMGEELTGDERYANRTLATAGLPPGARRRDDAVVRIDAIDDARRGAPPDEGASGETGSGPEAPKPSRAYQLRPDEDAAAGVRRAIAGRLDKAAERLCEADDGDALAEAIHGARKDVKKARAALRLIRDGLGEKAFRRENRTLRDAGRRLSASRDAEVKLATLDALIESDGDAPAGATAIWRDALIADRDRIVAGAGGEAGSGSAAGGDGTGGAVAASLATIEEVADRVPDRKIRGDGWKLLAAGLDTAYREGRDRFRSLPAEPDHVVVHELRKRGKDLWYQVRLLAGTWPEVLGATAGEIHDFTDKLGDHHDLAVLAENLGEHGEIHFADREALQGLIEKRQADLLAEARELGERIYAEKPKAFGRRMRAYWRASRRSAEAPAATSS